MTRTIRMIAISTALALVATVLSLSGPGTLSAIACGNPRYETFRIDYQIAKKAYRIGETMKIDITVTRPGPNDPTGSGLPWDPPMQLPAEDVPVWGNLFSKNQLPNSSQYGQTDAEGKATLEITLDKRNKNGIEFMTLNASVIHNQGGCPDPEEYGYVAVPDPVKTKPAKKSLTGKRRNG